MGSAYIDHVTRKREVEVERALEKWAINGEVVVGFHFRVDDA